MPTPRKRSCAACRQAKARCSLTIPICTRCTLKNIQCDYSEARKVSTNSLRKRIPSHLPITESSESPRTGEVSASGMVENIQDVDLLAFDVPGSNKHIEDIENILPGLNWDIDPFIFPGNHVSTSIVPQVDTSSFRSSIPIPIPQLSEPVRRESYTSTICKNPSIQWTVSAPWPEPKKLLHDNHKMLSRRVMNTMTGTMAANHIYATLLSYPDKLGGMGILPFIHNTALVPGDDHSHRLSLPEPLANCANFVPMFGNKTTASNFFVLSTLMYEVQRIHNEVKILCPFVNSSC